MVFLHNGVKPGRLMSQKVINSRIEDQGGKREP